ncbi:small ribosomal subunit protein eS21-like [Styela clava]|uniref:40S ribosomal protein S21-like n=1 Tax=Styela clava TaxID=7725 RepID=UPI001939589D|nr:40S ribosomal protein S21-like [Styela clava]
MQNDTGEIVDLYIPRKCSASGRIISAKDHASIQLNLGDVDENGRYTGSTKIYAICGEIRRMGESDDCLNRLASGDGIVTKGTLI